MASWMIEQSKVIFSGDISLLRCIVCLDQSEALDDKYAEILEVGHTVSTTYTDHAK